MKIVTIFLVTPEMLWHYRYCFFNVSLRPVSVASWLQSYQFSAETVSVTNVEDIKTFPRTRCAFNHILFSSTVLQWVKATASSTTTTCTHPWCLWTVAIRGRQVVARPTTRMILPRGSSSSAGSAGRHPARSWKNILECSGMSPTFSSWKTPSHR